MKSQSSESLQDMPPPQKKTKHHHGPTHKPRLGELVKEDDGIFVSFHTREGNVHNEYDSSMVQVAHAPTKAILTAEEPLSPAKPKINSTIVRTRTCCCP